MRVRVARAAAILLALLAAACSSTAMARGVAPTLTSTTTSTTRPPGALHKVLIVGDSIMFNTARSTVDGFEAAGIDAVNQSFPGTSLLGATRISQTFPTVIDEQAPDVVILEYCGVYLPPYPKDGDGRDLALSSPAWWDAWRAAALAATRDLAAHGARVYWVLLPADRTTWAQHDTRLDDLYRSVATQVPNVGLIDWRWAVSGPGGAPIDQAPIGPDHAMTNVRAPDGRHFSEAASQVFAGITVSTVLHDFGR